MQQLTPQGLQAVQNIANRYNISLDGAIAMLGAVSAGGGTMAQFSIGELGGSGQWMQGGMTMVGDMFNTQLQYRVSGLCSDLANLLNNQQVYVPAPAYQPGAGSWMASNNAWWPSDLGAPSSSGGQNDSQYAIFPQSRRLAIKAAGQITLYDTLDHQIGGVQQQSGNWQPLSFSSQFGTFDVNSLPLVNQPSAEITPAVAPPAAPAPAAPSPPPTSQASGLLGADDIFRALEQLAELQQKGVVSAEEFDAKKAELLARL